MDHDRVIEIQTLTETQQGDGGLLSSWTTYATVRGSRLDQNGTEPTTRFGKHSEALAIFRFRWLSGVEHTMRLVCESKNYNIVSIKEVGRRHKLEIVAKELGDN